MKFLIPYSVLFSSRAKTLPQITSFVLVFALPQFALAMFLSPIGASFMGSLAFFLSLTALYCVYEIGYLQNDVYTTRREKHPTHRMDLSDRSVLYYCTPYLIAARALYTGLILGALTLCGYDVGPFCCALILTLGCFCLHNVIRARANIATYTLLTVFKWLALSTLFVPMDDLPFVANAMFLAICLPRVLEHASKRKYGLSLLPGQSHHVFRVVYLGMLLICSGLLTVLDRRFLLLTVLSGWCFFLRLCTVLALHFRPFTGIQPLKENGQPAGQPKSALPTREKNAL